ncbi:MAG: metal-sulfur cluster assembly factor [Pannonibacter phragmitetus]
MTGEASILAALSTVDDPELGVSIVDLGLVREIACTPGRIRITLGMTTPTCPLGGLIAETASIAVEEIAAPQTEVEVTLDRAFRWTPDLAAPHVRQRFGGENPAPATDTGPGLWQQLRTRLWS